MNGITIDEALDRACAPMPLGRASLARGYRECRSFLLFFTRELHFRIDSFNRRGSHTHGGLACCSRALTGRKISDVEIVIDRQRCMVAETLFLVNECRARGYGPCPEVAN